MAAEFTIPGVHIRVFTKCLQCLSRIGESVCIEAREGEVILQTINSVQSAFVSVALNKTFFDGHQLQGSDTQIRCRVSLKVLMNALRSFQTFDQMDVTMARERLNFSIVCKKGIRKLFDLHVDEDTEQMQAIYDPNNCANEIVFNPRNLAEFVGDFSSNLDEVSLVPETNRLRVKCCKELGTGNDSLSKALQTELVLDASEFEQYTTGTQQTTLTFALKELKALLGFCDFASRRISLHYDESGRPIVFKMLTNDGTMHADFVIATKVDPADDDHPSVAEPSAHEHATIAGQSNWGASIAPGKTDPRILEPSPSIVQSQNRSSRVNWPSQAMNDNSKQRLDPPPGHFQPPHSSQPCNSQLSQRHSAHQTPNLTNLGSQQHSQHTAEVTPAHSALDNDDTATMSAPVSMNTARMSNAGVDVDQDESSEDEYVDPTPPPSPSRSLSRRALSKPAGQ